MPTANQKPDHGVPDVEITGVGDAEDSQDGAAAWSLCTKTSLPRSYLF